MTLASVVADGEIGIEDPNLLPVVGMRGDEDLVPLGLLVGVVAGARVKHDVKGDLPVAVVDVPVVRGTAADGEDDLAGVAGEVVTAAGYETLDCGRGTIFKPKENGVGEHGGEGRRPRTGGVKARLARRQSRAAGTWPGSGGAAEG